MAALPLAVHISRVALIGDATDDKALLIIQNALTVTSIISATGLPEETPNSFNIFRLESNKLVVGIRVDRQFRKRLAAVDQGKGAPLFLNGLMMIGTGRDCMSVIAGPFIMP